jgi:hypothetical protein
LSFYVGTATCAATASITLTPTRRKRIQSMTIDHKFSIVSALKQNKAQPFGAHFSTRLVGVNSKLTCALSNAPFPAPDGGCNNSCTDDHVNHQHHIPIE